MRDDVSLKILRDARVGEVRRTGCTAWYHMPSMGQSPTLSTAIRAGVGQAVTLGDRYAPRAGAPRVPDRVIEVLDGEEAEGHPALHRAVDEISAPGRSCGRRLRSCPEVRAAWARESVEG